MPVKIEDSHESPEGEQLAQRDASSVQDSMPRTRPSNLLPVPGKQASVAPFPPGSSVLYVDESFSPPKVSLGKVHEICIDLHSIINLAFKFRWRDQISLSSPLLRIYDGGQIRLYGSDRYIYR